MINESQILKALSKVSDPIKKKNLVSLKAIKQIKISKKLVTIEIQTSPSSFKLKEVIRRNCNTELKKLKNDLKYIIDFSINNNKEIDDDLNHRNTKLRVDNIKNIIAITSGKGGVGKSTISSNVAVGLSKLGFKVGLIDADIFGPSIPTMFNCENEQLSFKKENEKI